MDSRVFDIIVSSFGKIIIPGFLYTIPLTLISFAIGLLIAIATATVQVANIPVFKTISRFYIWVFRGTPLLVQIFIIFYGLPNVGILLDPIPAAITAFSLNVGAYASETIRGSILAIDSGQKEAGFMVGMNYFQIMIHVILPQALRNAIPALFNTFISLLKDTSLAANITVSEMFMVTQRIVATTYEPLILYLEVAFIYLLFCTVLSSLQRFLERHYEMKLT
ncbi:amino acid ABC transporter permease [Breznakia pachnodae]|jgi:cystine transport system permease protein|uniref:Cystine transport system permease protein n=1 Tax=Breznakia pachnodae TaxID=265178 RepID=A0ABU0E4P3_9FIRM|nr:amino acid ABC transporter permease [Breznakia pachnodae]MDQ0361785.1 cystine transport system permease protein [Breznakia pachnodae]